MEFNQRNDEWKERRFYHLNIYLQSPWGHYGITRNVHISADVNAVIDDLAERMKRDLPTLRPPVLRDPRRQVRPHADDE